MASFSIRERVNKDFDLIAFCHHTMDNECDFVMKNRAYKVISFEDSDLHFPYGLKLEDSNKAPLTGLFFTQIFSYFYYYYN